MSTPLLTIKLFIPSTRQDLVPRPRLIAKLNKATQLPLTIISAPAGFGKTTLVSAWQRASTGSEFPMAWLSLDALDNDRDRFFNYLLAAIEALHPDLVRTSAAILLARQKQPSEVFLSSLINDIRGFPQNFVLVLEDYHLITDESVHKAVAFLVEHMPPPIRLIILTRVDPPFPLSRLRARNQLAEIRAADLRFELSEATQFLSSVMRLELSGEQIEALQTRTEGWITGLQLAALSLQGYDHSKLSEFVTTFSGSNRYILDFLSDEVMRHQPDHVQTFLLKTSILDRLCAPLCNAVTNGTDSQVLLEWLEKENLFVTALDPNRQWYRYHHLFSDLLRNRLRHDHPGLLPELHRRASAWYLNEGQFSEAIQHASTIQDYDLCTAIIQQAASELKMFSGWGQILYWIRSLPEAEVNRRSDLALLSAWGLVLTDQVEGVESILEGLEQALQSGQIETSASQNWRGQVATLRARLAYLQGDFAAAIRHSHKASDLLSADELTIRYYLLITLGLSYVSEGDLRQASQVLEEAHACSLELGNPVAELESIGVLAEVQEVRGYLR